MLACSQQIYRYLHTQNILIYEANGRIYTSHFPLTYLISESRIIQQKTWLIQKRKQQGHNVYKQLNTHFRLSCVQLGDTAPNFNKDEWKYRILPTVRVSLYKGIIDCKNLGAGVGGSLRYVVLNLAEYKDVSIANTQNNYRFAVKCIGDVNNWMSYANSTDAGVHGNSGTYLVKWHLSYWRVVITLRNHRSRVLPWSFVAHVTVNWTYTHGVWWHAVCSLLVW